MNNKEFNNKTNKNNNFNITEDPFAAREAEKYSNPIPSREFILTIIQAHGLPLNFNQLIKKLDIIDVAQKIALRRRLKAMVRDSQIIKIHKNYFIKDFLSDSRHNYEINNLNIEDNIDQAIDNLTSVKVVGKLFNLNGFNYVFPLFNKNFTQDILVPFGKENGAMPGDLVVLDVCMSVFKWADPIGKINKILGKDGQKDVIISAAITALNLPNTWSCEIKQEVSKTSKLIDPEAIKSRIDLRDLAFVTIDGEDTKDFDDAVFCQAKKKGGWVLYVAIADVSHYIKPGSFIDHEAMVRGNSVYFPGKVLPMLPELFSNDLCSLKPNADRLCMVCEMQLNATGKLLKYKFYEGVICSKKRLTYEQVDKILYYELDTNSLVDKSKLNINLPQDVLKNLIELHKVFLALHQQRACRGTIEFISNESKVIFNKEGKAIAIKLIKRNIAHKIIEECMLCANVATAKFLEQSNITSIYRVHEGPNAVKLLALKTFLASIGLALDLDENNNLISKDYARLLQDIVGRKDYDIIQMILLRSMCQAVYSIDNIGHFGLAYPAYTHFTSPIRRYADLLIHRHIKVILNNSSSTLPVDSGRVAEIAAHCSMTERRADDATKEVIKACKCQYLVDLIGTKVLGMVSGVTKFGLFVEIKDIFIDGLVHINSLGKDYFIHDPVHHKLIGEKTGVTYSLGMELDVIISKVDLDRRRIDLVLLETDQVQLSNNVLLTNKKIKNKAGAKKIKHKLKKSPKNINNKVAFKSRKITKTKQKHHKKSSYV